MSAIEEALNAVETPSNKKTSRQIQKEAVQAYEAACNADPSLDEKAGTASVNIKLVATLASTKKDEQSLVVDKEATDAAIKQYFEEHKEELKAVGVTTLAEASKYCKNSKNKEAKNATRKLDYVPGIVGYRFENIGSTPITYPKQVCVLENGTFVKKMEMATVAPGESFDMTRPHSIVLLCQPEYSFEVANAKVVQRGSKADDVKSAADYVNQIMNSAYLKFTDESTVHDDSKTIVIDTPVDDTKKTVVVLDEFKSMFAYLENEKVKAAKTGTKAPKTAEEKKAAKEKLQRAMAYMTKETLQV